MVIGLSVCEPSVFVSYFPDACVSIILSPLCLRLPGCLDVYMTIFVCIYFIMYSTYLYDI